MFGKFGEFFGGHPGKKRPVLEEDLPLNENESGDIVLSRKKESGNIEKISEQPLTPEQALVYQSYAANLEGETFSEKVGESAYQEAEILINRLKKENFSWLDIDWKKVDEIADIQARYTLIEERVSESVLKLMEKDNPDLVKSIKKTGKKIVLPLMFALSLLGGQVNESKGEATSETGYKVTERFDRRFDWLSADGQIYSPHIDIEKGEYSWKAILEPLAIAGSIERRGENKIVFDIPYEYARLFDTGKPINQEDYKKLQAYTQAKILEEIGAKVLAFEFDEKAYEDKFPGQLKSNKIKITGISLTGFASPEAIQKESEQPGNIDQQNIELASLRAENSLENIKKALDELGINYDADSIKIEQIESQFSEAEMQALSVLANELGKDSIFDLIKDYNFGKIEDSDAKNHLDSIVGSKRKVAVTMETEGNQKMMFILPLPLLLGLLPFIRLPRINWEWPSWIRRQRGRKEQLPNRDFILNEIKLDKSQEIYIAEVVTDIVRNLEMYYQIADYYSVYDLRKREQSVNCLTHVVLQEWMRIDNEARAEHNETPADYYKSQNQKTYAMMHALVVRRLAMERSGFFRRGREELQDMNEVELREAVRAVAEEEIRSFLGQRL